MIVRVLPSARERDARANLEAFVAKGMASSAFGDVNWGQFVWKGVDLAKQKRASAGRTGQKDLYFLTGKGGERGETNSVSLMAPFVDFLKAMVRIREDMRPQHIENHRVMIRAARYLHDTLAQDEYDPCRLLPRNFDEAAALARRQETDETAYCTGKALAEIGKCVDERGIGRVRIGWSNSIPRPRHGRIGKAEDKRREKKLPSEAALDALPKIANLPLEDPDLIRMRIVELLNCGGWRINELLSIPANCEVEETAYKDGAPELGPDGQPIVRYGLRYFAEKGFGATVKWIPTPMVDVAKRAVKEIRRITDPVRADARWMRANPGRVNLPALRKGDPNGLLSMKELEAVLGLKKESGSAWAKSRGLEPSAMPPGPDFGGRSRMGVRLVDVCAAVIRDVPKIPAGYPVKLEDHLFLIRENFVHRQRGVINGSVRLLIDQMVGDFITGGQGRQSVFERHGFTEPDGSPITVTTHQFRHWLNTLAQEGGMSQELIARWSGRRDMGQNAAYDHSTGRRLADRLREMIAKGEMTGPLGRTADRLPPADRKSFLDTHVATAHVTEIGLCIHDWSLAPCPIHGDCTNCNEHVVDKGNLGQRDEARRQLAEIEHTLSLAEVGVGEEVRGASRWVEAHRRQRDGLKAVLAVHDDIGLADGTLVHMARGPAINQDLDP